MSAEDQIDTGIQPLGQRVLVKRLPPEEQSLGGIWIPDQAKGKQNNFFAEVRHVGPGVRLDSGYFYVPEVKPGDKVVVPQYDGHGTFEVNGEKLLVFNEEQIFAIMFEDDDPRAEGYDSIGREDA